MDEDLALLSVNTDYVIAYAAVSVFLLLGFAVYKYRNNVKVDASEKHIRELLIDISRPEEERRAELLLILEKRKQKVIDSGKGYIKFYKNNDFSIIKFVYLTVVWIIPGIYYGIKKLFEKKEIEIWEIKHLDKF